MIRVAIRGFVGRARLFEDLVEVSELELDGVIQRLAAQHSIALAEHELHMLEIEFLDEPDQNQRFFRFGTDPAGMVRPIEVKL